MGVHPKAYRHAPLIKSFTSEAPRAFHDRELGQLTCGGVTPNPAEELSDLGLASDNPEKQLGHGSVWKAG